MAMVSGQPVRQRVGPSVRALREERRLSLNSVATEAGISPSHLSRIERGLTVPSYDVLARTADALGTDLTSLTSEEATTKTVDADLDALFDQFGLPDTARADLRRLEPPTRAALLIALRRIVGNDDP